MPLTVFRVEPQTRFLVVEMGARGIGHIDYLTRIAPPSIGIVLNVGTAHVGEFGSREAIAVAKAELVQALPPTGLAVLNVDDPAVRAMAAADRGAGRGWSGPDPRRRSAPPTSRLDDAGRPSFTVTTPDGQRRRSTLPLHGEHHVGNALAVAAAALECGLALPTSSRPWPTATPASPLADGGHRAPRRRDRRQRRLQRQPRLDARRPQGPRGDGWGEDATTARGAPGPCSARCSSSATTRRPSTTRIGRLAVRLNISRLVVVGETAAADAHRRPARGLVGRRGRVGRRTPTPPTTCCAEELRPGDVVLFKSSRDAGLRWLGDRLRRAADAATDERGGHDVKAVLLAAVVSLVVALLRHAAVHPVPRAPRLRPVHPRRRPDLAPHQARHAHHGRRGHHRLQPRGIRRWRTLLTGTPLTWSGVLVLFLMTGLGLVGFLDDYIKISKQRSLGLRVARRSWSARPSSPWSSPCWRCSSPTSKYRTPGVDPHLVRPRHRHRPRVRGHAARAASCSSSGPTS